MKLKPVWFGLFATAAISLTITASAAGTAGINPHLPAFITARSVHGAVARPIALRILAPVIVNGEDAIILLSDVPAGAKFSTGIDLGFGSWLMAARDARGISITLAKPGHYRIQAQLLSEHFKDVAQPTFFFVTSANDDANVDLR